jgi:prepilin-type N-terminal cleavage/methylation domain-containing protein
MSKQLRTAGLTLVELSIVLVIIGLLIAALLGGQELVTVGKINKTISDMKKLKTAYEAFASQYDAIPGDMKDGEQYFGADKVRNGNGDKRVYFFDVSSNAYKYESCNLFSMLTASRIYTQTSNTDPDVCDVSKAAAGISFPRCSMNNNCAVSIALARSLATPDSGTTIDRPIKNAVFISGFNENNNTSGTPLSNLTLKPSEAYSIDMKLDDGLPLFGQVKTYKSLLLCGEENDQYKGCSGTFPLNTPAGMTEEKWEEFAKFSIFWASN